MLDVVIAMYLSISIPPISLSLRYTLDCLVAGEAAPYSARRHYAETILPLLAALAIALSCPQVPLLLPIKALRQLVTLSHCRDIMNPPMPMFGFHQAIYLGPRESGQVPTEHRAETLQVPKSCTQQMAEYCWLCISLSCSEGMFADWGCLQASEKIFAVTGATAVMLICYLIPVALHLILRSQVREAAVAARLEGGE